VEQLDALLEELRREGVTVDERIEASEFGRFGWVMDPEGNRVELWESAEGLCGCAEVSWHRTPTDGEGQTETFRGCV
jgi:hypothetical protein